MATIEGIEGLAGAVGRVEPQGEQQPLDALEQRLTDELGDGIDSVEIHGPNGTRGAEAVEQLVGRAIREAPGKRPELFDASEFAVGTTIDGKDVTEIVLAMSGSVKLPGDIPEAQDIFEALRLGKPVDVRVQAFVATKSGGYKEDKDGNPLVTGKVTLKAVAIAIVPPENL